MTADIFTFGIASVIGLLAGGISGGLVALKLSAKRDETSATTPDTKITAGNDDTEFVNSEIDIASVQWAEANNQPPQAAGLMAERLKTLHKIGKGKGWL